MNANVGSEGYTKGVGVLQNDIDIFDINQDGKVDSRDSLDYARAPIQEIQVPQVTQEEQFQEPSSLANPLTTAAEDPFNDYEDLNKDGIVTQEELDESGRLEEEDFYNSPYYQSMDFPKYFDPATGKIQYNQVYSDLIKGDEYRENDGSFNLIDAWKNWSGSEERERIEQEAYNVYDRVVNEATMYGEEAYFDGHIAQQVYQGEGGFGSSNTYGVGGGSYGRLFTDRQTFNSLVATEGIDLKKDFDPTPYFDGVALPEGTQILQGIGLKGPNSSNYSAGRFGVNKFTNWTGGSSSDGPGTIYRLDTNPDAPVGSYTMVEVFVPDPPDPDAVDAVTSFLDMASLLAPPLKVISTAIKLIDGQDLSTGDIVGTLMVGFDMAGLVTAPSGVDVDGVGPPNIGQGFGGLSYQQTQGLITSAIDGDPTAFIASTVVPPLLDTTLGSLPEDSRIGGIFQADDLKEGLTTVVSEVASGADFDDALVSGLGTYVEEGGGLNIGGVDVDLGPLEDVVKAVVAPIVGIVADIGSSIDDTILQPIKDSLPLDEVAEAGRVVDDELLQPVKNTVETLGSTIDDELLQPVKDTVEETGRVIDDTILQPVKETVEEIVDVELPEVDVELPEVDIELPEVDIDLPEVDIDLPRIGLLANRTTEGLFGAELSKFKEPDFSYDKIQDYIRKRYA